MEFALDIGCVNLSERITFLFSVYVARALITNAVMIFIDDSAEWIFDHCLPRDLSHDFIQRRAWVVSVLALKADRVLDQFGRFLVERS